MLAGISKHRSRAATSACITKRWAKAIWPTPVMGIVGLMKTGAPVGIALPRTGPHSDADRRHGRLSIRSAFGGTQYAKVILKQLWGLPPALDMDYEKRVQAAMREIVRAGLAESAHDLSDGGLAVALAECSFGADSIGACVRCGRRRESAHGSFPRGAFTGSDFHLRTGARGAHGGRLRRGRHTNWSYNKG